MSVEPNNAAAPLSSSSRHRLQKVFEHGQRCVAKQDHDYANQLFTQCVVEDPASIVYLQAFLDNLEKKFAGKKGSKLAGLKIKSQRSALAKAAAKGDWPTAFQAGCQALALSPFDSQTLVGLADACQELSINECQLYYLKWALRGDAKNPVVNRRAALQLARMGQFDQAIACWQRVAVAKPEDEEARHAIAQLSVEKTIYVGGYEANKSKAAGEEGEPSGEFRVAQLAKQEEGAEDLSLPIEERFKKSITDNPAETEAYLNLADLYLHEDRLDEADEVLSRARQVAGSGDFDVTERIENVRLRRARRQVEIAEQQAQQAEEDAREEADTLVNRLRQQANQIELEVYAARSDREPDSTRLKFELGVRLKRAGKIREAIPVLQAARGDSRRNTTVLLGLGECFQRIEQFKLALSNYEQAIESAQSDRSETAAETHKLALYRAGVLSTGMRELDRAERYLTELAGLDFGYRDVADRLDKISSLRDSG
ncbi:tetratricopeptide repeat protein [Adhaeretor mobilis]|uniref:Tetratricopeptide repeat protein n=1 Tax=Adhaeretor mobilis TaxID=1930276 RepID=A0A517MZ90_9BACT|nr:tetratricopeptide repeat protein [Adhaeretor mobilis]QDT00199.1 Tetratricopeptide repeat protein [Adhaeretor mobilis]